MRRVIFIILTLFLLPAGPLFSMSDAEKDRHIQACEAILGDLHDMVNDRAIKGHASVTAAVNLSFAKFKEKKLGITIDPDLDEDIYSGMQFQCDTAMKQLPVILVSPYMIRLYKDVPSIVLSALVHEMQHAKSYFDNTKYFVAMRNSDLENYLYELDSYNIEANFITAYLAARGYSLTPFEQFLAASYKEDNLSNFSFGMLGHNMELAFYLNGIERKQVSYEHKIGMVSKVITDLLALDFDDTGGDWDRYKQAVTPFSALKFTPQVVRNIEGMHGKIKDNDNYQMKAQNPELYNRLLELEKKFLAMSKHYTGYLKQIQKKFRKVQG